MDCVVKFDYISQGPDQLTINEGDTIYNAEAFEDGWYKGTLMDKTGFIPEKFLKIRTSSLPPELLSTLEFEVYKDYVAKKPDELSIYKDDVLGNVQIAFDGWNKGTLIKEPKMFPDNFAMLNVNVASEDAFRNLEFQAIFDYTAKKSEELTIRKGNIITNVQYVMKGWNRGTLKEECGLIPDNFVKINVDKISAQSLYVLEFVVILEYTSSKPDELTIRKGDIIRHVVKAVSGWNKGDLGGKIGLFPANFVKIRNPTDNVLCSAEFIVTSDYTPKISEGTDYLTIRKGDLITKVEPMRIGWYKGTIVGRTGMFPDNFVKISNANSELLKNKEFLVTSDYTSSDSEKMSLEKGDIIRNASYVSTGWYKGTKVGRTGIYPNNFAALCYSKVLPSCLATFEFEVHCKYSSNTTNQLSLAVGDVVKNVQCSSTGWLKGTVIGKTGVFPSNFVEVITSPNKQPSMTREILTQEVQRMSIREHDIPEELLCPVCLELPEKEIYQCKNGHGLCGTCILSIQNCPQCRICLKVDGGLIRNRIAESLVCTFKARLS